MKAKANPPQKPRSRTYAELIEEFPLRPIKNDRQADRASELAFQLSVRPKLTRDEQDYLDVLDVLIETYEDEHHPIPVLDSPRELLQFLIDEHKLTLTALAQKTGIRISTLSEILSGKRKFGVAHIEKLCAHFRLGADAFIDRRSARAG
jgi:HTH-type transcriptional regulator/antitoxin HigA